MGEIGANYYRPALIEFANLNFLIAAGRLQKYKLRTAPGGLTPSFLESENILVEGNRFLQVVYAIARVQQFLDHSLPYRARVSIQTPSLDKTIKTASLRVRGFHTGLMPGA